MRHDRITFSGENADGKSFEVFLELQYPDRAIYSIISSDGAAPEISHKIAVKHASTIYKLIFFARGENSTWTVEFESQLTFSEMAQFLEGCIAEATWKEYEPA